MTTTKEWSVAGMHCADCAHTLERLLREQAGIDAEVDYTRARARLRSGIPPSGEALDRALADTPYRLAPLGNAADSISSSSGGLEIAIIGSGSAAFAAAIRAGEAGARVTMIEQGVLGGTCVNVGCVPSKIFIRAALVRHYAGHHPFAGLGHAALAVDRARLQAQQQHRVEELRQAKYQSILDANEHIHLIRGRARFGGRRQIEVEAEDGRHRLRPDRILIATGAVPAIPSIPGLAGTPYWTSTEALAATELPTSLVVLGGSAVGLELAQAFFRLGVKVTVIELAPRLLPREDPLLGERLKRYLGQEGLRILTGAGTESVCHAGGKFELRVDGETIRTERLLVVVGRRANTDGLGLELAGVATEPNGAIRVDSHLRTGAEHIYAAGDCTANPQFVYVAAAAGTRAAINMTGGEATLDLSTMPTVVFTDPGVAGVGLTEETARLRHLDVETRTLELENVPRALANFDTRGFIKLVANKENGRLLGAQVLAPEAGEIIQSAALAIRNHMTVEDLAGQLFPYLTLVEGIKLCAQTFTRDVSQLSCCAG